MQLYTILQSMYQSSRISLILFTVLLNLGTLFTIPVPIYCDKHACKVILCANWHIRVIPKLIS